MPLDLTQISFVLTAVSSMAIVAGTVFVVFQLRQNAKLINATVQANRSSIAFSLLERIVDDSFVQRRKKMYDTVKKYRAKNWEGLMETMEDLEARNYAYMFELLGQLVKDGVVDKKTVMDALKYIVVIDWNTIEPMIKYLNEAYRIKINPWGSFEWLAKETEKYLKELEAKQA